MPKILGAISSRLIHLIFNYQPGLAGLELTKNICESRRVSVVSWKYFNKPKDQKIFQNEKPSQTPKDSIIKVIEPEHNTKPND